jgi:uncharacterized membrane protein YdjX (TVP38/TMEM64 family)
LFSILNRFRFLLNRQNAIAVLVILVSWLAYWRLSAQLPVNPLTPEGLRAAIANLGMGGILVYIAAIALSVVLSPIPGAPLTVVAGSVWGAIPAGIYSVIGGFSGGLLAYFIGKTLGRGVVHALTGKIIYFSKDRGEVYLGWIIFASRLLPVLSFDLISYSAGITGLSLPIYIPATFFGMIPSTFFLTFMGSAFTFNLPVAIALSFLFLGLLIFLPWGIQRYNWFGIRNLIHIED